MLCQRMLRSRVGSLSGRASTLARVATARPTAANFSTAVVDASDDGDDAKWAPHDLVMFDGVHQLTFGIQGDVILGVAGDNGADAKVFGVSTMTGCLHHTTTAAHPDSGLLGVECLPQRLEGETNEFLVHMEVNTLSRELRFRHDEAGGWVNSRVKLPEAVRPWVCAEAEPAGDVAPSVRLVSYSHSTPLSAVRGLERVVSDLPAISERIRRDLAAALGSPD